jgi:hypothetical protein
LMVCLHCRLQVNRRPKMSNLKDILNNDDEEHEDMESLQKRHKGFIFSPPQESSSPTLYPSSSFSSHDDSSDIAIQTLHALADMHSAFVKRGPPSHPLSYPPSSSSVKSESLSPSPTRKRSLDALKPPSPGSLSSSSSSSCSRRDYKKKQLVVRSELMQMKQAKAAVKLGTSLLLPSYPSLPLLSFPSVSPFLYFLYLFIYFLDLGIPPSTFSKRWRESLPDRKWPYRIHKKVEKSIQMLKVLQHKGHDVTSDLNRFLSFISK